MCNDQISLSFRVYHCHVLLTGVEIYVKLDEIWVCVWGGGGGVGANYYLYKNNRK